MDVKVYSLAADGDKYLTPHFQVKEFRCRDGSDVVLIHEQLPWDLESIRYQASQEHGKGKEIPLIINSGYRTVAYNSTLKNASKHSQHLYGYAADIHMPGVSIKDLKRYARNVSPNHGGVGVYGSFLHFDKREAKAALRCGAVFFTKKERHPTSTSRRVSIFLFVFVFDA